MMIVKTFTATDEDGNEYTIHVVQGEHDSSTAADGVKEMQTDDGRSVNWIHPRVFQIIDGTRTIFVMSTAVRRFRTTGIDQ
jgi:hypothetical protein